MFSLVEERKGLNTKMVQVSFTSRYRYRQTPHHGRNKLFTPKKINILFRHGVLLFQLFWKYVSICIAKVVIYLGYLQLLRAWSF